MLQRAIEAEVQMFLEEYGSVSMIDGRRAVVRNGYLPEREILTTVGPVTVGVPKVRDRSGAGVKFNSTLAPPQSRRSARVAAALPWLHVSGDLGEALEVLVRERAKGLSPGALGRLKAQWSEEYQAWTRRDLAIRQYACWGDEALGFWAALEQVYPDTVHQRCWCHRMGNVLAALPKHSQRKAKSELQAIWMADSRQ